MGACIYMKEKLESCILLYLGKMKKYANDILYRVQYMELMFHKEYSKQGERKTSSSDTDVYRMVCLRAAQNDKYFKKFRRNAIYNAILEHVPKWQGQQYLEIIEKRGGFNNKKWNNFFINDLYGYPRRYLYLINNKKIRISPTTIRYVKVLQDIQEIFGNQKFASVAEIGIGYGGEGRILISSLNIEKYFFFDIPEVLELARKYLKKCKVENKSVFVDGTDICLTEGSYDLVISNYAFSELTREVQEVYLDLVIKKSKRGYITWNRISRDNFGGYSVEELLHVLPNARTLSEEPLTAPENCIIVWGD